MIRIASVPASHVYVRHLSHPSGYNRVLRLPDPVPADGATVPGGWWPPLMLEPGWVTANHHRFDAMHVHFGFDAVSSDVLASVLHELKMHDKPLIYTVHDLRNPHHHDRADHDEQQDVLIAAADQLVTLTPGAAQEIAKRWTREAIVLPHPHVLSPARINAPRRQSKTFVVAVHTKSVRANMDPLPVLDALVAIVGDLRDATLRIDVHDEIFQPGNHWYAPTLGASLRDYDVHRHVDVRVHPYFSDDELWNYLSEVSVSVLPYRFGTHSGWLEACFDLGTAVIVPNCGYYAEQRPCGVFDFDEDNFTPETLQHSIIDAHNRWCAGEAAPRATWSQRRTERITIAQAHHRLYRAALT